MKTILTLWCALLFLVSSLNGQELRINEFMAANTSIWPEMYDFGDYSDWIELHNPGPADQSLDNYFISDNGGNPLKWKIPQGAVVPAHGYLLIWADGFDDGPGSVHQRPAWPWENFTTRHYHSNFKLSKDGEDLVLARATPGAQTTLIPAGATWRYLDNGSDQGTAWTDINFNDAAWGQGSGQLGYGDGDETTVLSYGGDPDNKFITTYFRHSFQVSDAADLTTLTIQLQRDDGAILHLNGNEILRVNMPEGDVNYTSLAAAAVSGDDEDAWWEYVVSALDLVSGQNVLAVEIHQVSGTSSDISFDLELKADTYTNAVVVDEMSYGFQDDDVSMGRDLITGEWTFFGEPTPGSENSSFATLSGVRSYPVTASLESGFYSGSQTISLNSANLDDIYYTLDGSRPGSNTTLYSGPITLTETTILKARTVMPDELAGEILTRTYFIDEGSPLSIISLTAEPPTLWDDDIGIYENEYKQREIPVQVELFDLEQNLEFRVHAGARLGGQNIWTKPQKPFTIYFRDRYGDELLRHKLFEHRDVVDFTRIVFRNGGDDWEETLIRDPLAESLMSGMMDAGYMAYRPATLFLNGEYWGIHNIREKFDPTYFAKNYGADPGNIDHLEYASTPSGTQLLVIEGDLDGYNQLLAFIQANDLNQADRYAQLQELMNVDGFIDHLIMTQYTANTSWGHNREWWRPRDGDGKWQWLVVDLDRGLNPSNININIMDNMVGEYILFNMLLDSDLFKSRFVQRSAAHLNNTFHEDRVVHLVDSLSAVIAPEIPRHAALWGPQGGVPSLSGWENELQNIRDFAAQRNAVVFTQINQQLGLDGTVQVSASPYISEGGSVWIEGVPSLYAGASQTFFRNREIHLRAVPNPGYEFIGWNHGPTSAEITYDCSADGDFIALFQPSGEIILPDVITENTILETGQVYVIVDDLVIPDSVSLVVEADVELRMSDDSNIIVEGLLLMGGGIDQPIRILPNTASGATRWGGVSFDNAAGPSNLSHVHIMGASHGVDPLRFPGAISAQNSHLTLTGLVLEDVEFPIYAEGGSLAVYDCSISSPVVCDFINVKRGDAMILNNHFYGAQAPDTDAIDLDGVTMGSVVGNWIYNFQGANSDGIDLGENCENVSLFGNKIYHSSDKGISVGQCSNISIERNLIVGCVLGIALKDSASATIRNNTLVNNEQGIACYEKNLGAGGGHAESYNNIFYANSLADISADQFSTATSHYSLSERRVLVGPGNIVADPQFVNSTSYDFSLLPGSPAIDAGDPSFPLDEDGSPIDMGAYYVFDENDYPFEIPGQEWRQLLINEFLADNNSINPDEAGEFDDWLEIHNPTEITLDLSGFHLTDNPDNLDKWQIPDGAALISPGEYLLVWCDEDGGQGPLHSNFKLSASGEFLALVAEDGVSIIDSLSFGAQAEDVSMGRRPDEISAWVMMTPSPGTMNHGPLSLTALSLPEIFTLEQNYPNPFNPSTRLRFGIPQASEVAFFIYDIRGRLVFEQQIGNQRAGWIELDWNGSDQWGQTLAAGVYLARVQAGTESQMIKMLLLK